MKALVEGKGTRLAELQSEHSACARVAGHKDGVASIDRRRDRTSAILGNLGAPGA